MSMGRRSFLCALPAVAAMPFVPTANASGAVEAYLAGEEFALRIWMRAMEAWSRRLDERLARERNAWAGALADFERACRGAIREMVSTPADAVPCSVAPAAVDGVDSGRDITSFSGVPQPPVKVSLQAHWVSSDTPDGAPFARRPVDFVGDEFQSFAGNGQPLAETGRTPGVSSISLNPDSAGGASRIVGRFVRVDELVENRHDDAAVTAKPDRVAVSVKGGSHRAPTLARETCPCLSQHRSEISGPHLAQSRAT